MNPGHKLVLYMLAFTLTMFCLTFAWALLFLCGAEMLVVSSMSFITLVIVITWVVILCCTQKEAEDFIHGQEKDRDRLE